MATPSKPPPVNPQAPSETATLPPSAPGEAVTLPPPPAAPDGETLVPTGPAAAPGTGAAVPGYALERELGRGGMGVVYRARQTRLNRPVALKMILAGSHAGAADLARFQTEAEAIARLRHPNIVQVYEVGEHEGKPFFSLEFCGGGSLERKLGGTPLPPKEAASLVETLARAMQVAHEQKVIHRDLKPANVLLAEDGTPKITDFGLAKKLDEAGQTASGAVMGTPSYMAPEQAGGRSGEIGPLADVYALGAILYECLTGRPPFKAATALDTVLQVISDEPVPPSRLQPKTPKDLETICLKCLQKEPRKRYATATTLAEDLGRFQSGEPILARPVGPLERTVKWVRRRPAVAALLGTVVLVTVAGVAAFAWAFGDTLAARDDALAEQSKTAKALRETEKARQQAEEEKRAAQKAREAAVAATEEMNNQLTRADWLLYASKIALAQRELEADNVNAATAVLKSSRPDFRSWEYDYLQAQLDTNAVVCKAPSIDAISRDGKRLASSDYRLGGWGVTVWDTESGKPLLSLKHSGPVRALAFNADGTRLACGGEIANQPDKPADLKVWDLETRKVVFTLDGHVPGVRGVCYSPDGKRIASLAGNLFGKRAELKVWDALTGKEILHLPAPAGGGFAGGIVGGLAYSPDGKRIAAGMDQQLKVWDAETGKEVLSFKAHLHVITSLAYSPDGKRIATTSPESKMKVWDAETGKEVLEIQNGGDVGIAFSPDGKRIAGPRGELVTVWGAITGKEIRSFKTGTSAGLAFNLDGKRLAIAAGGTVKTWEIDNRQGGLTFNAGRFGLSSMALSPDGQRIATASALLDSTVKVWDAQTGKLVFDLKGHKDFASSLAFSRDGKTLASASRDGTTRIWEMKAGNNKLTLKSGFRQKGVVALGPDGNLLATNEDDKTVAIWDLSSGKPTYTLPAATESVLSLAFSSDGRYLASGNSGVRDNVKVWNVQTGQVMFTHQGQNVFSVAFSPDGRYLASAGIEESIRVWSLKTGAESFVLRGHMGPVESVMFSPDGKRLATASADGTIKLWDAHRGFETITLSPSREPLIALTFSSDGQRIACAGLHGTVRIWDAGLK